MKTLRAVARVTLVIASLWSLDVRATGDCEVAGFVGMAPIPEGSYAAIWVPVPTGSAIAGVRWFNNDGTISFPALYIAGGDPNVPVNLDGAILVAEDILGVSNGWSQIDFREPIASLGDGLYCLLVFPLGGEYTARGEGGGAAIGYTSGDCGHQGWFGCGDDPWMRIEESAGLAIDPIFVAAEPGMVELATRREAMYALAYLEPTLMRAFPNPFNPQIVVEYSLPVAMGVSLRIFDMQGRLVRELVQETGSAGIHSATWLGDDVSGRRVSSGVYLARFAAGAVRQSRRILLLK